MRDQLNHRHMARGPEASDAAKFSTLRPCYVVLHAPSFLSRHSLALSSQQASDGPLTCPEPPRGATRHCIFDRYTCRTKIAASPAASTKVPNLIDTLSHPTRMRILRANIVSRRISASVSPCNVRNIVRRSPKSPDTPAPQALQISRHTCREIFTVSLIPSTKLPKYLGTLSRGSRAQEIVPRRGYRLVPSQFGKNLKPVPGSRLVPPPHDNT